MEVYSENQLNIDQSKDYIPAQSYEQKGGLKKVASKSLLLLFLIIGLICLVLGISFYALKIYPDITVATFKDEEEVITVPSEGNLLKRIKHSNYQEEILSKNQLISKIQKSARQYECLEIEPLFHTYDYTTHIMYFQTYDQVLIPSCQNLNNYKWSGDRENIYLWNDNREVTEWAFHHVQPNDYILYYRPGIYNMAEVIMLSKLVGPDGQVFVIGNQEYQSCISQIQAMYQSGSNIQFLSIDNFTGVRHRFTVLIGKQSILESKMISNTKINKMLIYLTEPDKIPKEFESFSIQRIHLQEKACGNIIYSERRDEKGFYSFSTTPRRPARRILKKEVLSQNSVITKLNLTQKYENFKQKYRSRLTHERTVLQSYDKKGLCLDLNSPRSFNKGITTIYKHKLYDIALEQVLEWEGKRETIEWMRQYENRPNVYYEVKQYFNLLAIIQIAYLIYDSTLQVVCSPEECEIISKQLNASQIKNVQLLKQTNLSSALLAGNIITDNQNLIKQVVQKDFLKNGALLGFFTKKRNESYQIMNQLNVHFQLRQIIIPQPKQQCAGFKYWHYFWNCSHPHGFYDITPSKYVVYQFWIGQPERLNLRTRFLFEETMSQASVEFKIINPEVFKYFQVEGSPIHPGFYLLSALHKSDYTRGYLLHHYGGGYGDVKHYQFDWRPFLNIMEQNSSVLGIGAYEKSSMDVGCHEEDVPLNCTQLRSKYKQLLSNGHFIYRKYSPVTTEWRRQVEQTLTNKYEQLKNHPPQVPRQSFNQTLRYKNGTLFVSQYPIRWGGMTGELLARAQYPYLHLIQGGLPYPIMDDYRTENVQSQIL